MNNDNQIPAPMAFIFEVLDDLLGSEGARFKGGSEDDLSRYHHSLGQWLRNEHGLWEESGELYEYLKSLGLWHADDMSGVVLSSYWRYLHGKPLGLNEQVQHYLDYWEKSNDSSQR